MKNKYEEDTMGCHICTKETNINTLCLQALIHNIIYKIQKIRLSFTIKHKHSNYTTFSASNLEFLKGHRFVLKNPLVSLLLRSPLNNQGNHFPNTINPTLVHHFPSSHQQVFDIGWLGLTTPLHKEINVEVKKPTAMH